MRETVPPQLRLPTDVILKSRNSDFPSSSKPQGAAQDIPPSLVAHANVSAAQERLQCVEPEQGLFAAPSKWQEKPTVVNSSLTNSFIRLLGAEVTQHADKENLLMGLRVPRFNMIEV